MTSQGVLIRFKGIKTRTLLIWSVLVLTCIALIAVAYFVHGGLVGMAADDIVYKYSAYDLATASWRPNWNLSPVRTSSFLLAPILANLLPANELPVRLGIVALHLLNVLLLAALAFRLTHSIWTALLAAMFLLAPVFASEAVIWFSAATFYLPSLFFFLVGAHLILSCHSVRGQFPLLVGAVAAWCAMITFVESGFFLVLLIPALVWLREGREQPTRLRPALIAVSATYILFVAYAIFALRTAPVVALHGETAFDPIFLVAHRIPDLIGGVVDYVRDWAPGGIFAEALNLGGHEWLSSAVGLIVVGLATFGVILTAALYPLSDVRNKKSSSSGKLFILGILWVGLALAPALFFVNLQISPRVLLFPSAGFAICLAGLLGWLVELPYRWHGIGRRFILLLAGCGVLLTALTMAGLVSVRQLRWDRDREEISTLGAAIGGLPNAPVWIVPIALDEKIVSPFLGRPTSLDHYLLGVFQIPWAAEPALRMQSGKENVSVIGEDEQGRVHLTGLGYAADGNINTLTFERTDKSQEVPIAQLLAFSYQKGRLILFNRFTVAMPDGAKLQVDLPLSTQVAMPQVPLRSTNLKLEGDSP